MKHLQIVKPGNALYHRALTFANTLYQQQLETKTNDPSDVLIVATQREKVVGCIGLNTSVQSNLFLSDTRYQRRVQQDSPAVCRGEQNIFAVQRFPAGVPLLIAAVAAYAQYIGIHYIVYAGVLVSCKTVDTLGYSVEILGNTGDRCCVGAQHDKYRVWLQKHQPQTCVLSTENALSIYTRTANRYKHKVSFDHTLSALKSAGTPQAATLAYA